MKLIRKILPAASHAFLGLMFLMLANSIFFYHEHDLDSGETIRHAHPFLSEEEEQKRDHTENEIILLDLVTHAQYFLPERIGFCSMLLVEYQEVRSFILSEAPSLECIDTLSLRGPPSSLLFLS
ncbi:hypothetical protein [Negadavirga shengliensis]|uniref:Uncharacterized protein n=1 Tax=Negadavirga shengliensis TaxID=1389218 RepID=A0ABV9SXN2_9BACT